GPVASELAPAALLPGDCLHQIAEEVVEALADGFSVERSFGGEREEAVDYLPVGRELVHRGDPPVEPLREVAPLVGVVRVRGAGRPRRAPSGGGGGGGSQSSQERGAVAGFRRSRRGGPSGSLIRNSS